MVHLALGAVLLVASQDTLVLGLDEVVARAITVSPLVAASEGAVHTPRGERAETRWPFPANPVIEFERWRRRPVNGLGSTSFDRTLSVTQEIEIAGQGFVRASAAGRRAASILVTLNAMRLAKVSPEGGY